MKNPSKGPGSGSGAAAQMKLICHLYWAGKRFTKPGLYIYTEKVGKYDPKGPSFSFGSQRRLLPWPRWMCI